MVHVRNLGGLYSPAQSEKIDFEAEVELHMDLLPKSFLAYQALAVECTGSR
jgi:hypothetical protein